MNNVINNSVPDELDKIADRINEYADDLVKDMKKLISTHQGMRKNWNGKQYDDVTRVIESTNAVICKQADKLVEISHEVHKDAKQLRIANASNIG